MSKNMTFIVNPPISKYKIDEIVYPYSPQTSKNLRIYRSTF